MTLHASLLTTELESKVLVSTQNTKTLWNSCLSFCVMENKVDVTPRSR